jgi:nitrogen-specific signal transduction histidine kinase
VRFRDDGIGIPPADLRNLFIPFFTTKEKGTGLGLPISQRIIENHGGTIEVRSQPGSGSTFTVLLPVEADAYTSYADLKKLPSTPRKATPAVPSVPAPAGKPAR